MTGKVGGLGDAEHQPGAQQNAQAAVPAAQHAQRGHEEGGHAEVAVDQVPVDPAAEEEGAVEVEGKRKLRVEADRQGLVVEVASAVALLQKDANATRTGAASSIPAMPPHAAFTASRPRCPQPCTRRNASQAKASRPSM